jgi:predicted transcriptional regulator of viral defense system
MEFLRRASDLRDVGYTPGELSRLVTRGDLTRIRRGCYGPAATEPLDSIEQHRGLVHATFPLLAPDAVVSHTSAAVLHGLPLLATTLTRVQLTRDEIPGGKARSAIQLHAASLDESDVVVMDGIAVTSLPRTVADLARSLTFEQAVVPGDAALRLGLSRDEVEDCLLRMQRWPGVIQARRVTRFLDGRSESPGESRSRVGFLTSGLPSPQPQREVYDERGRLIGRTDFAWEQFRTLGEFDGKAKYGRLLKPGETPDDAVYREKVREDALRGAGWQVVRWTWADLGRPQEIASRLRQAFARSRS